MKTILFTLLLLSAAAAAEPPGNSIYNLNAEWTDQSGAKLHLKELSGQPVVITMAYTSCTASCPLMVNELQRIDGKLSLRARGKTKYVLVTFDPERDTPAKLAAFAKTKHLDEKRWRLLNGKASDVRELAALLGVKYRKEKSGDFSHSNILTAVDGEGVIQSQKTSLGASSDPLIEALEKSAR